MISAAVNRDSCGAAACGIAAEAVRRRRPARVRSNDCRPIGVGEGHLGALAGGGGAVWHSSGGGRRDDGSAGFSVAGMDGGAPLSSSVMAILRCRARRRPRWRRPAASESSRRWSKAPWPQTPAGFLSGTARLALLSLAGWSAAACAARRAAAMKFDVLAFSLAPGEISRLRFPKWRSFRRRSRAAERSRPGFSG